MRAIVTFVALALFAGCGGSGDPGQITKTTKAHGYCCADTTGCEENRFNPWGTCCTSQSTYQSSVACDTVGDYDCASVDIIPNAPCDYY